MKEFVIIPHGNQLKQIRELQTKICLQKKSIPIFPLFVRFSDASFEVFELKKLKSCSVEKIVFTGKEIFFSVNLIFDDENFNEIKSNGKMLIGKIIEKNDTIETISEEDFKIPFPVFKISEVEFSELDDGIEWNIFSEKWIKSKR